MGRSTVHYADSETNSILKKLHNKLRPAGTPVQRVEYIIELLLLRIFEVKLHKDKEFTQLRAAFAGDNAGLLFSELATLSNEDILPTLNKKFFPFYAKILAAARAVWTGNLTPKIQDQLVLIEEVFSNSNFSNNVTSGNMAEIIGLVAEIDQDRLLKTDLLGDAIESALSETGGTHDLGLHRTPDHIRQFMVGMIAPTFADALFDPTIGSGGFMFDAFEYVLQGVTRNAGWPGPKAHPELAAWFKDWFAAHPVKMPPQKTATDFYRTGVGGIEYLGMIRKMAAINFYVRGLNPGSIIQGDALEKFGSEALLPESKSAIIANPPFGAERDKDSYPNVWSEYPTETETTILFVKLMLEALKPGGRCAVIVSEGFLTWDQNSARALRRSLLDDCTLQAVISLPQGVFVSKGGQGPKTSILVFTKGGPTRDVWYYKVTNDGFTAGTNRKPQPGCQLVEALDLFHRYVRIGGLPPESRHSFTIPADWIKTLDPRVKDRIRAETRAEMGARAAEDKARLADKLDAQLASGKLTKAERKDRLEQHDDLWRSKIENAVAQKIERAHLFSFNLPNYRSSLTPEQLAAWHAYAAGFVNEDDPSKLFEKKYREIAATAPDKLHAILSTLDPRHTLELDIARQFLNDISPELYTKHPHLRTLQEIIATQQHLARIPLRNVLRLNTDTVAPSEFPEVKFRVLGVNNETGVFLNETLLGEEIKQRNYRVKPREFCYNPYRINVGSIGFNTFDYDNQIISGAYVVFGVDETEIHAEYLAALFKTPQFNAYVNEKASGGVRMNFKFDHLEDWEIPVPSLDDQVTVTAIISQQMAMQAGVDNILFNFKIQTSLFTGEETPLSSIADIGTGSTPSRANPLYFGGDVNWALTAEVNEQDISSTKETLTPQAVKDFALKVYPPNTILVAMYGQGATRGKAAFLRVPAAITQNCAGIVITHPDVLPRYVYYFIRAIYETIRGQEFSGGGVPHLNLSVIANIRVPIPSIAEQQRIIADLDTKMELLDNLRKLKADAENTIEQTLNRIWES